MADVLWETSAKLRGLDRKANSFDIIEIQNNEETFQAEDSDILVRKTANIFSDWIWGVKHISESKITPISFKNVLKWNHSY